MKKKFFLLVLLLVVCFSVNVHAETNPNSQLYENQTVVGYERHGNMTVVHCVEKDSDDGIAPYVSEKSFANLFHVYLDDVYSFTVRHDVTFAYGIPTNKGSMAEITSSKVYVSKTNSSSAYYADTSSLSKSVVSMGDPAKVTSSIKAYKKSNNKYDGTMVNISYCYATGAYK